VQANGKELQRSLNPQVVSLGLLLVFNT